MRQDLLTIDIPRDTADFVLEWFTDAIDDKQNPVDKRTRYYKALKTLVEAIDNAITP